MSYQERRRWADERTPKLVRWTETELERQQANGKWRPQIRFEVTGKAIDVIGVDATGLHCGFRCRDVKVAGPYQDVTFRRYTGSREKIKFTEGLRMLDLNAYAHFDGLKMVRMVVHRMSDSLKKYIREEAAENYISNRSGRNGFLPIKIHDLRRAGLIISEYGWLQNIPPDEAASPLFSPSKEYLK